MTILLFLVDTSASMAQKNYMGISALDSAKALIADIMKHRSRVQAMASGDRYMLMTTEEFPACVKSGWKENSQILHDQLKAVRPGGRHLLKNALINAFQFVNLHRAQNGIDNYGHGRMPAYQDPCFIISISDGSALADIPNDFELLARLRNATDVATGKPPPPGQELTEELFRWDQKLFSVVFRMGARCPVEPRTMLAGPIGEEKGVLHKICASTGGRTFSVTSHKQQVQLIERLLAHIQFNGVTLRFEFPDPGVLPRANGEIALEERKAEIAAEELRKDLENNPKVFTFARSQRVAGHWPIPEAFHPDQLANGTVLPPRKAHPLITIGTTPVEAIVNTEFPFEKYELEQCRLTDFILERTIASGNLNLCWQLFVTGSYRSPGPGKPFGYLKAATSGTAVNMFLMPYNYPIVMRLLEEQRVDARLRTHPEWRKKLDQYVETCPAYYKIYLKKALVRLKLTGGWAEDGISAYPAPVVNYLARCKQTGKEEFEQKVQDINMRLRMPIPPPSYMVVCDKRPASVDVKNFRLLFEEARLLKAQIKLEEKESKNKKRDRLSRALPGRNREIDDEDLPVDPETSEAPEPQAVDQHQQKIDLGQGQVADSVYRNPFIIRRTQLIEMIPRLRTNLDLQLNESSIPVLEGGLPGTQCTLQAVYDLHSMRSANMGNYDEYLKALRDIGAGPLKEVEIRSVRDAGFGNPFKKDKRNMSVDEVVDVSNTAGKDQARKEKKAMETSNKPPKRKAGPLALNAMQTWRERRRTSSISSSVASDFSHTSDDLTAELEEAGTKNDEEEEDDATMELVEAAERLDTNMNEDGVGDDQVASTSRSLDSGIAEWGLDEEASEDEGAFSEDEEPLMIDESNGIEEGDEEGPSRKRPKLSSRDNARALKRSNSLNGVVKSDSTSRESVSTGSDLDVVLTVDDVRRLKSDICAIVRQFKPESQVQAELDELLYRRVPCSLKYSISRFTIAECSRFKCRNIIASLQERLKTLQVPDTADTSDIDLITIA